MKNRERKWERTPLFTREREWSGTQKIWERPTVCYGLLTYIKGTVFHSLELRIGIYRCTTEQNFEGF